MKTPGRGETGQKNEEFLDLAELEQLCTDFRIDLPGDDVDRDYSPSRMIARTVSRFGRFPWMKGWLGRSEARG